MCTVLIGVHACDYGKSSRKGKQDGQTLGIHSKLRINAAVAYARRFKDDIHDDIVFVFSAGHLDCKHRCLRELQAEYLRSIWPEGGYQILAASERENIWGTEGELRYLQHCYEHYSQLGKVLMLDVTEDYHVWRTRVLARLNGVEQVIFITASSRPCPPTLEERFHELKSLVARLVLPRSVRQFVTKIDRSVRAWKYGL